MNLNNINLILKWNVNEIVQLRQQAKYDMKNDVCAMLSLMRMPVSSSLCVHIRRRKLYSCVAERSSCRIDGVRCRI